MVFGVAEIGRILEPVGWNRSGAAALHLGIYAVWVREGTGVVSADLDDDGRLGRVEFMDETGELVASVKDPLAVRWLVAIAVARSLAVPVTVSQKCRALNAMFGVGLIEAERALEATTNDVDAAAGFLLATFRWSA